MKRFFIACAVFFAGFTGGLAVVVFPFLLLSNISALNLTPCDENCPMWVQSYLNFTLLFIPLLWGVVAAMRVHNGARGRWLLITLATVTFGIIGTLTALIYTYPLS